MVNPNVNYGHWDIMMCRCRFITCNKCTTLVTDVDNGEGYACVWVVLHGKSLYLSPNFSVNLKLL